MLTDNKITKYTFSGHETFQCKGMWLKKGYDFVKSGKKFTDDQAVIDLGVGKNMVASIKFWLRAFGITNEEGQITKLGDLIFADDGFDPFLEDTNTLWILHFSLLHTGYATLYEQVFLNYHKERKEFTKSNLLNYIKRQFADKAFERTVYNENTITKDIATLIKMYSMPDSFSFDDFASVLIDLNLIKKIDKEEYEFNYATKAAMHPLIYLFAVRCCEPTESIIEYDRLLELALVFCMSQGDLTGNIMELCRLCDKVSYNNTAGEQLFTINEKLDKYDILSMYYTNN